MYVRDPNDTIKNAVLKVVVKKCWDNALGHRSLRSGRYVAKFS